MRLAHAALRYSAGHVSGEPLDEIDRILARELVADGRATLAHLAATAGLSVSAVQSRVRRLESRGVVTGYTARINPEAVGQHAVGVRGHHPSRSLSTR